MIPLNMFRLTLTAVLATVVLLAVACGSGDADEGPSGSLGAGQITCEQLFNRSYQYSVNVFQEVGPLPTAEPTPTGVGRPPFQFTTEITDGKVEDGVNLQAHVYNTDGHNEGNFEAIQIGANDGYVKDDESGQGWSKEDTSVRRIPFPYWPMAQCDALSPDIDTTQLGTPTKEDVNGTPSEKYTIEELGNGWLNRSPDFGAGSDHAAYIETFSGNIWISEKGRYPTKVELSGTGNYPSGQVLTLNFTLQVWDMGGDINIEEPPLGTQPSQ